LNACRKILQLFDSVRSIRTSVRAKGQREDLASFILDGFVKSPAFMSFRAKREIFREQPIEKIGFLPKVEMTNTNLSTFYEIIILSRSQEKGKGVS
jgi:hypothetical protein